MPRHSNPNESVHAAVLRVLTYNIHGCMGGGRAPDSRRTADIIADIDADIVALQEVDLETAPGENRYQAETIGEILQMDSVCFPVEETGRHLFGLAVLSRFPFGEVRFQRLPNLYPQFNPRRRAAVLATLDTPGGGLHLINTHLSVFRVERRLQLDALLAMACPAVADRSEPLILCGDLNAGPASRTYRTLAERMTDAHQASSATELDKATFHARSPAFRLDHIFVSEHFIPLRAEVRKTAAAAGASDHLPVVADVALKNLRSAKAHDPAGGVLRS